MSGTPRIEDFYDVPPAEAVLVGGPHAGERMTVDGLPLLLVLPDPFPERMLTASMYSPGAPIWDRTTTVYQRTGSVRDDGARVYAAVDERRKQ